MGLEKIKTKNKIKTDKLILKLDKILLEKEEREEDESILNKGITPDITVKNDNKEIEEKQQLDKAIEIIDKGKGE